MSSPVSALVLPALVILALSIPAQVIPVLAPLALVPTPRRCHPLAEINEPAHKRTGHVSKASDTPPRGYLMEPQLKDGGGCLLRAPEGSFSSLSL